MLGGNAIQDQSDFVNTQPDLQKDLERSGAQQ